jgi:phthiocerol/phenolphthiocerol synthesis type-I polyketide synthase E
MSSNSASNGFLKGVAIIGMAARVPGAKNVQEFWHNLTHEIESISNFSDKELIESGVDIASVANDPSYVRAGSVLEDVELFDAAFFGVNPKEAELMDPQGRVILECSWEALEHSGYNPENCPGSVAVYVGGSTSNTYFQNNLYPQRHSIEAINSFHTLVNNEVDSLALRISYKLDLKGPSVTVLSTCSSSLVAIYHACESLLNRHCDMALAGGISLRLPQKQGYWYEEGGMNSLDGHCRPFDEQAHGTVFGSGVGIVVLKRLEDAVRDGDSVCAVIRGIAINNDGAAKRGYAAPSADGQARAIRMAHAAAGVDARSISYVEAHGTATPLGDPIEVRGLTQAFRATTDDRNFCGLGSVKANIGHLDTTSGVAGLIKTALALRYGVLPPTLHYSKPNPKLEIESTPFYVVDKLTEWKTDQLPRRAGLNSFGVGGTNAHAVLEEAPPTEPSGESRPCQLLMLSARTEAALEKVAANLASHLRENNQQMLADIAYTLQAGRKVFNHRCFLVSHDVNDAAKALETRDATRVISRVCNHMERSVVFMFPGQGSQHVNMGLELYQSELAFREHIDQCAEILKPLLGMDLRSVLYPQPGNKDMAAAKLGQTAIAQPAIFAIEYALAKLWMKWGVRPQRMIGHSVGEFAAACLSGVFSLEDALTLLSVRGRLMQQLPTGSMLAVAMSEQTLAPLLREDVSMAAVNGPFNCVVAGPTRAIQELEREVSEKGSSCRYLHTSHAFHSSMMDPILDKFTEQVRKLTLFPPRIPFISSSTGTWITAKEATDPIYWTMQIRRAVQFNAGRQELARIPDQILLEVGPGNTLTGLAKHPAHNSEQIVVASMASARETHGDLTALLTALGRLWLEGVPVNWQEFYAHEHRRRVALPTYPFERKRYWIDPPKISGAKDSLPRSSDTSARPAEPGAQPQALAVGCPVAESKGVDIPGSAIVFEKVMSQQLQVMARQLEVLEYCQLPDESETAALLIADDPANGRGFGSPDNGRGQKSSIEEE